MQPTSIEAHARLMVLAAVVRHAVAIPPMQDLKRIHENWSYEDREAYEIETKAVAEAARTELKTLGLWSFASSREQAFLDSHGIHMDSQEQLAASWSIECVHVLMWALQFLEEMPPLDREPDYKLLKNVKMEKPGLVAGIPALRPAKQIKAKRDDLESWHWRVRTRQLIEENYPLEPNAAMREAGLSTFDDIVRFSARQHHEEGMLPEILDDDFVYLGKPFRNLEPDEYQLATSIITERHFALNWLCGKAPGNSWEDTPTDT